jgi:hypothetical protein
MIFRNLLQKEDKDIQTVLDKSGPEFLDIIEETLSSQEESLVVNTIYVLSCIASGNSKQKKIVLEDRYLLKAIELLKSAVLSSVKTAVLNLLLNLVFKDSDSHGESRARKHVMDLGIVDII